MDIGDYQTQAAETMQAPAGHDAAQLIPLLGLAGEVGTLLSEYKKRQRDGGAHERFRDHVDEEIGDILWYLAAAATAFDRSLDDIAAQNLAKVKDRWPGPDEPRYRLFDDDFPTDEQIPRRFEVTFEGQPDDSVVLAIDGQPAGDALRDNNRTADEFRYHDVIHLAFAAHLGWSPTVRGILFRELGKRKRRSNPVVDETEDGGRAIVIDEAIVALVFAYASDHRFLEGITRVDCSLLKTIKLLTANLEVSARTAADWETAILAGFDVWRTLKDSGSGTVTVDLTQRRLTLHLHQ